MPRFSLGIGLVNYAISSRATETILTPELANRLFLMTLLKSSLSSSLPALSTILSFQFRSLLRVRSCPGAGGSYGS